MIHQFNNPNDADVPSLTRMDMHVHSWASNGPAIAALGLIDCPECCSPPEAVYEQARRRGMDLVTITDHDTVDGAMELVERGFEGVIVGEEVTVRFPEDGRGVHVLVWGLSPSEHEQIHALGLRSDVYGFARWLRDRDLAHSVAHPLDGIGDSRAIWRLERLALLFRGFELLNGAHAGGHYETVARWVGSLTADRLERMARKHRMTPLYHPCAPRAVTAGSDDHGLLNVGRTWAGVRHNGEPIDDPEAFVRRVMSGAALTRGRAGHPLALAHQFISVGMNRYAAPIHARQGARGKLVARKIASFAGLDLKRPSRAALTLAETRRRVRARRNGSSKTPLLEELVERFGPALERRPELAARLGDALDPLEPALAEHEPMGALVDELTTDLSRRVAREAHAALQERDWSRLRALGRDAGALAIAQAPYIISLFLHNKDRWGVERVEEHLARRASKDAERPTRVALFTDTLADVNGVSRFIRGLAEWAARAGEDLHVFAFDSGDLPDLASVHPVRPIFSAPMPGYESLRTHVPPVLSVLREAHDLNPDVVHVSTPGPLGLLGALAAEMVRAPALGVYHTDFPAYTQRLFNDASMVKACERLMRSVYSRFDRVLTRSAAYVPSVRRLRVDERRIVTLRAGVDGELFNPERRDPSVWRGIASPESVKVLYAGRVSVEKNTPLLEQVWKIVRRRCEERGIDAELIVVGDGPDRGRLERSLRPFGARFAGYHHGETLAAMYASADLFVFPSVTDTLGQVVLEAQASGLPAVVTTSGGPRETVEHERTGLAIPATEPAKWVDAIVTLIEDDARRTRMGRAGAAAMRERTVDAMYEAFWREHTGAHARRRSSVGLDAPVGEPLVPVDVLARLAREAAAI